VVGRARLVVLLRRLLVMLVDLRLHRRVLRVRL